jgi:WD40 repeat protein
MRLWDLETGTVLRRFEGHTGPVNSVAMLPDGWRALSASDDRTLRLWDLETGAELRRFEGHVGPVFSVAVLLDGRRAISGSWDNSLRLWDIDTTAGYSDTVGYTTARIVLLGDSGVGKTGLGGELHMANSASRRPLTDSNSGQSPNSAISAPMAFNARRCYGTSPASPTIA